MAWYFVLKVIAVILRALFGLIPRKKARPDATLYIRSRDTPRDIRVYVYYPPRFDPANPRPTPVLINFCGSGFVMKGHGIDDEFCRYIADHTDHTVLDVEYRLAPEHPFPAALNDAEDIVNYARAMPNAYRQDHISISGFSAGGNIAVSTAMNRYGPDAFYAVIAFYPPVDATIDPKNKRAPVAVPTIRYGSFPACALRFLQACYLYPHTDPSDPRVSPARGHMASFPRNSLWITADHDSLAAETESLVKEGQKLPNCFVNWERMRNCGHAWDKFAKDGTPQADAKDRAYALARDILVRPRPVFTPAAGANNPPGKPLLGLFGRLGGKSAANSLGSTVSAAEAGPSGPKSQQRAPLLGGLSAANSPGSIVSLTTALLEGQEIPTEPSGSKTQPVPVPAITIEPPQSISSPTEPSHGGESLPESPAIVVN